MPEIDAVEELVGQNTEFPENSMPNPDLQLLFEFNRLQSQRESALMLMLQNTTDGYFRRIMTPGMGSINFEIIRLIKERTLKMLHCLDLSKELERFERQFQWHVEKAYTLCTTALHSGEGKLAFILCVTPIYYYMGRKNLWRTLTPHLVKISKK